MDHSLTSLEERLPDHFMRVHRAYIINCNFIKEIRKGFNGKLVFQMTDKNTTRVTTGSSYTSQVKEKLKF